MPFFTSLRYFCGIKLSRITVGFLRPAKHTAATMFLHLRPPLSLMQSATALLLFRPVRSKHYTCPQSAKWDSTVQRFLSTLDSEKVPFSPRKDQFRAPTRIRTLSRIVRGA